MKKLITIALLLISSTVQAGILGFGEKECPPPPGKCYYSIHIAGDDDGQKVLYVFEATCGEINQVGIIDEVNLSLKEIKGLKTTSTIEYKTTRKKAEMIELLWGKTITPIQFYQQ